MPLISFLPSETSWAFYKLFLFHPHGKEVIMHSNCNQCRQLYGKGLSSPLDMLQLFHVLNPFISAAKSETQGGRLHPRQFLARWIRRNCGIKAAVKRTPDTADYILICKLRILVNGWPWKYRMLSVIKLLICKKFCSKEAFSWLSSKTSFKGLICEMQDNMHLHISFLFR